MGRMPLKADTINKDYISDTAIFSDIFNYYIHDGEQVISPESLAERDPAEIAIPYGADGAAPLTRLILIKLKMKT